MGQQIDIKVRFSETDLLGHVNNANYFVYLEEARIAFFKATFPEKRQSFVVASVKCDFIQQAYFEQHLLVTTTATKVGNKSFVLAHEITDKDTGSIVARGESIVVHFNVKTQQSEALSEDMRRQLERVLVQPK